MTISAALNSAEEPKLCGKCGKQPAQGLHRCPYQYDINDNDDPEYCDCCDACQIDCAMDI